MRSLLNRCCVCAVAVTAVLASSALAKAPAGRYTIANGEVTDTKTGLIWRQTVNPGYFTNASAIAHCTQLGGGWRAPNIRELYSLVDASESYPAIDSDAFPDTPSDLMWTGTPQAGDATEAWVVDFRSGAAHSTAVSTELRVRCVR